MLEIKFDKIGYKWYLISNIQSFAFVSRNFRLQKICNMFALQIWANNRSRKENYLFLGVKWGKINVLNDNSKNNCYIIFIRKLVYSLYCQSYWCIKQSHIFTYACFKWTFTRLIPISATSDIFRKLSALLPPGCASGLFHSLSIYTSVDLTHIRNRSCSGRMHLWYSSTVLTLRKQIDLHSHM